MCSGERLSCFWSLYLPHHIPQPSSSLISRVTSPGSEVVKVIGSDRIPINANVVCLSRCHPQHHHDDCSSKILSSLISWMGFHLRFLSFCHPQCHHVCLSVLNVVVPNTIMSNVIPDFIISFMLWSHTVIRIKSWTLLSQTWSRILKPVGLVTLTDMGFFSMTSSWHVASSLC